MCPEKPRQFTFVVRGLQWAQVIERMFSVDSNEERGKWVRSKCRNKHHFRGRIVSISPHFSSIDSSRIGALCSNHWLFLRCKLSSSLIRTSTRTLRWPKTPQHWNRVVSAILSMFHFVEIVIRRSHLITLSSFGCWVKEHSGKLSCAERDLQISCMPSRYSRSRSVKSDGSYRYLR